MVSNAYLFWQAAKSQGLAHGQTLGQQKKVKKKQKK
tara:strand:- start:824 stop:931 length:108 start_codon:yes stop_codon:yes gene_type:complete